MAAQFALGRLWKGSRPRNSGGTHPFVWRGRAEAVAMNHKAREMFQRLGMLSARARTTREDLFAKLKEELLRPRLRERKAARDLVEHDRVSKMLAKIEAIPVDSDDWLDAIDDLKECVGHHIKEEENELFPGTGRMVRREQGQGLAEEIQQANKR
jgi:hypothetical protein